MEKINYKTIAVMSFFIIIGITNIVLARYFLTDDSSKIFIFIFGLFFILVSLSFLFTKKIANLWIKISKGWEKFLNISIVKKITTALSFSLMICGVILIFRDNKNSIITFFAIIFSIIAAIISFIVTHLIIILLLIIALVLFAILKKLR